MSQLKAAIQFEKPTRDVFRVYPEKSSDDVVIQNDEYTARVNLKTGKAVFARGDYPALMRSRKSKQLSLDAIFTLKFAAGRMPNDSESQNV